MVTGKRKGFDVGDISFSVSMPVPIFMDLGGQAGNLSQLNRVLGLYPARSVKNDTVIDIDSLLIGKESCCEKGKGLEWKTIMSISVFQCTGRTFSKR